MAKARDRMHCTTCGVDMNHHADKVDYTETMKEPSRVDPAFGGVVEEFHRCPKCGGTATRIAEP
jgi:predicted RNA-binding Zn-ribbon protein involved in translation (DUF1610 family)